MQLFPNPHRIRCTVDAARLYDEGMLTACLVGLGLAQVAAGAIPPGPSKIDVDVSGTTLEVFTYKPARFDGRRMILVFHGVLRNADVYRDHARGMGDRFNALIIAPKFDSDRFPSLLYQRGGILRRDGTAAPKEEWTYAMIPKVAQAVRGLEQRPEMPYYLIGHSAGGQFLTRMAGFAETGAVRIVSANAGSALFPTREMPFGYGFGNLPAELSSDDILRRYLAQPLTLYLGSGDNRPDENFDSSREAMLQGEGRYQRNVESFRRAEALAKERGWEFNWQMVRAPMIGHDHAAMFDHPACERALFGPHLRGNR
jgi:pimeloyl-ACP methyl ester carboxylesterase